MGAAFSTWGSPGPNAHLILEAVIKNVTYCLRGHASGRAASLLRQEISFLLARGVVCQLRSRDRIRERMDEQEDFEWVDCDMDANEGGSER